MYVEAALVCLAICIKITEHYLHLRDSSRGAEACGTLAEFLIREWPRIDIQALLARAAIRRRRAFKRVVFLAHAARSRASLQNLVFFLLCVGPDLNRLGTIVLFPFITGSRPIIPSIIPSMHVDEIGVVRT
jgi:hypothetical protein